MSGVLLRRNRVSEKSSEPGHLDISNETQLVRILKSAEVQPFSADKTLQIFNEESPSKAFLDFALSMQRHLISKDSIPCPRFTSEKSMGQIITEICRIFKQSLLPLEGHGLVTDWIDSCGGQIHSKLKLKMQLFQVMMIPIFGRQDLRFEACVAEDNFVSKRGLIQEMIRINNGVIMALIADEEEIEGGLPGPRLSWFCGYGLRQMLFSIRREEMADFEDRRSLREEALGAEHFANGFSQIPLNEMFEIMNLELFKGSISECMLYVANDGSVFFLFWGFVWQILKWLNV